MHGLGNDKREDMTESIGRLYARESGVLQNSSKEPCWRVHKATNSIAGVFSPSFFSFFFTKAKKTKACHVVSVLCLLQRWCRSALNKFSQPAMPCFHVSQSPFSITHMFSCTNGVLFFFMSRNKLRREKMRSYICNKHIHKHITMYVKMVEYETERQFFLQHSPSMCRPRCQYQRGEE